MILRRRRRHICHAFAPTRQSSSWTLTCCSFPRNDPDSLSSSSRPKECSNHQQRKQLPQNPPYSLSSNNGCTQLRSSSFVHNKLRFFLSVLQTLWISLFLFTFISLSSCCYCCQAAEQTNANAKVLVAFASSPRRPTTCNIFSQRQIQPPSSSSSSNWSTLSPCFQYQSDKQGGYYGYGCGYGYGYNHDHHDIHTSYARLKRKEHYNEALLHRILSGRTSSNPRWRRRTKRAAATLGFSGSGSLHLYHPSTRYMGIGTGSGTGTGALSSSTTPLHVTHGANILAFQKRPRNLFSSSTWTGKNYIPQRSSSSSSGSGILSSPPSSSTMLVSRPVPPLTSSVSKSTLKNTSEGDSKESRRMSVSTNQNNGKNPSLLQNRQDHNNNNNNSTRSSNPPQTKIIRFLRRQKMTPSQHEAAKLDWAAKYTSLDVLRASFGTNRNKLWGDFDTKTTRKLYHTLLPRALLGLYEAGLWCPTDLAPLAFEARLAAKKYARERCVLPGRIWAMIYDGYRSWRSWGTWSVEGMSWEQVWNKYETQILEEYMDDNNGHIDLDELQDEITARICVRILERSCITNEHVDKMFLKDKDDAKGNSNTMSRSQKRRRKAERDLLRIKDRLERDVQELQLMELEKRKENNSNKIPFLMDILSGFLPNDESYGSTAATQTDQTMTK